MFGGGLKSRLAVFGIVAGFLFIASLVPVFAQTGETPTTGECPEDGALCNPLESETIEEFILAIIKIILRFAVPVIVFFIMYAGFLYVTAQGDPSKIETARTSLTWAVIGGVIILGAELIITVIQGTVGSL